MQGHFDHFGSVIEFSKKWNVPVYAHRQEQPYLTGKSDPALWSQCRLRRPTRCLLSRSLQALYLRGLESNAR